MTNIVRVKFRDDPTPETRLAWLPCEKCKRATLHNFHESREEPSAAVTTRWFTMWYKCDKCLVDRIWGTVAEKLH